MQPAYDHTLVDYFKLFKVFDLKKLEKTGLVKIVVDRLLNRKIISVEGSISTANYITFTTNNLPNILFNMRYLYVQGFVDTGRSFCIQLVFGLGNRICKTVLSTIYKIPKRHLDSLMHLPLSIMPARWNIIVIDLYQITEHFGAKAEEARMAFRLISVEIRASSKVKGIFQSDYLYSVDRLPKDISFPLKKDEDFFEKYHYTVDNCRQDRQGRQGRQGRLSRKGRQISECPQHRSSRQNRQNRQSQCEPTLEPNELAINSLIDKKKPIQKLIKSKSMQQIPLKNAFSKEKPKQRQKQKAKKDQPIPRTSIKLHQQTDPEADEDNCPILPPKPQGSIAMQAVCMQGFTLSRGRITTLQSYLIEPICMPVHRPVTIFCECPSSKIKILLGYDDGSLCLWDTVHRSVLVYFKTELQQLRLAVMDMQQSIIVAGLDKQRREMITIVQGNQVVFRQISTFNILGLALVSENNFQAGLISYGFQNIRLWKVNNANQVINGLSISLGQSNRKVKYTGGVIIKSNGDTLALICDSNGYITTVSIAQAKMVSSVKVDDVGLDHIMLVQGSKNNSEFLIANEKGNVKFLDIDTLQMLTQYSLNNRIKDIVMMGGQLRLTHYNKSIGNLNLESSVYTFHTRCHAAQIVKMSYNNRINKLVSVAKDNTIRIWHYACAPEVAKPITSTTPSLVNRLQQLYEFLINGEDIVDVVTPYNAKDQYGNYAYIGSDSGKIRKINLCDFTMKEETVIEESAMAMSISKNGRCLIATYTSGNTYILDTTLLAVKKYPGQFACCKLMPLLNGFNRTTKEFFRPNYDLSHLEVYAMKNLNSPVYSVFINEKIFQIELFGPSLYLQTVESLKIYTEGTLTKIIGLDSASYKLQQSFRYPLLFQAQQLYLQLQYLPNRNLQQVIDVPESVACITVIFDGDGYEQGLVFACGTVSHALYVIQFNIWNCSTEKDVSIEDSQVDANSHDNQDYREISFSKDDIVAEGFAHTEQVHCRNSTRFSKYTNTLDRQPELIQTIPDRLKGMYDSEEKLYQQVKEHVFPDGQPSFDNQGDTNEQPQELDLVELSSKLQVNLLYGYQARQSNSSKETELGRFNWLQSSNSMILQTNNYKGVVRHSFAHPVTHKLLQQSTIISSLSVSSVGSDTLRYMVICTRNIIKLYNVQQSISYIRTIESFTKCSENNCIYQSQITNCGGYLVVLSYSVKGDNLVYIHVIDLACDTVVCSSYLQTEVKIKNKCKNCSQMQSYKLLINPFKQTLQFIIFHPEGLVQFYRITSIFSLQTMQIEEIVALVKHKINTITCTAFIMLDNSSAIAIATQNGSVLFVDCRTAAIIVVCVSLLPTITAISFAQGQSSVYDGDKLILFSNSGLITIYDLKEGIHCILQSMQSPKAIKTNKLLTLDGQVMSISNTCQLQQLVITKCGTLWLVDYADWLTIKVSSIHTVVITNADIIQSSSATYLLSCGHDGCMKMTNLSSLQQVLEIYKPRKRATAINVQGQFTLVAFDAEVYFYDSLIQEKGNQKQITSELASLGSVKFETQVVAIRNIPFTGNYFILTVNQVFIIYAYLVSKKNTLRSRTSFSSTRMIPNELQIDMQSITRIEIGRTLLVNTQFAPYAQFLTSGTPSKINIWLRKCLKRAVNPLDELASVHELSYYLIDSYSLGSNQHTFALFLSDCSYLCAFFLERLISIRNYVEHSILREISLANSDISTMQMLGEKELVFLLGDTQGNLSLVDENGLVIDKVKAIDGPIRGIKSFMVNRTRKVLVYGGKYSAILKCPRKIHET